MVGDGETSVVVGRSGSAVGLPVEGAASAYVRVGGGGVATGRRSAVWVVASVVAAHGSSW